MACRAKGLTYEEVAEKLSISRAQVGKLIRKAKDDAAKQKNEKQSQLAPENKQAEYWDLRQAVLRNETPEKTSWINSFIEVLRSRFGFGRDKFTTLLVDHAWQLSRLLECSENDILEPKLEDGWWFRHYYTYKLAELLVWCDRCQEVDSLAADLVRDFVGYWAANKANAQYVLDPQGVDLKAMDYEERFDYIAYKLDWRIRPSINTDQLYSIIKRIQDHEAKMATPSQWFETVFNIESIDEINKGTSTPKFTLHINQTLRLYLIIQRISLFILDCYSTPEEITHPILDFVDFEEIRRRLDRDAMLCKLLLYDAISCSQMGGFEPSSLWEEYPQAWEEIEDLGHWFEVNEANSILDESLDLHEKTIATTNFAYVNMDPTQRRKGSRWPQVIASFGSIIDNTLLAFKQRDLGQEAIDIFYDCLRTRESLQGRLKSTGHGYDSPAFKPLEKLCIDFGAVYGLKGLLINPLKTQMGSDVEFFDSRMKPTSNRND